MQAEQVNIIEARLADYKARELAARGYL